VPDRLLNTKKCIGISLDIIQNYRECCKRTHCNDIWETRNCLYIHIHIYTHTHSEHCLQNMWNYWCVSHKYFYAYADCNQRVHKNQEPLFAKLNINGNSQVDLFDIHGWRWIAELLNKHKHVKYYFTIRWRIFFLILKVYREYISQWFNRWSQCPRDLRHELFSLFWTLGSCVRIPLEARMSACVCSVFVLGSGLATGWSLVRGVLPNVLVLETEVKLSVSQLPYAPSGSNRNIPPKPMV
jgi:hypothetical protein